jgi:branched-subunit amino acid aminotransferase/4-amino-4-deoxychorismate lyase
LKGGFVLYNGKFHKESEVLFSSVDAFRVEVGVKEVFRTEDNEILFADKVYENLLKACGAVNIPLPDDFDMSGNRLKKDVSRLLNKNKYYLAGRVTVRLFPGEKATDCLLDAREVKRGYYPINSSGLLLGFYGGNRKNISQFSRFEISSRFLWAVAASEAKAKNRDNMILFNSNDFACESIGASFAYIKGERIVFPDSSLGGYYSVLSDSVKSCAVNCGLDVEFSDRITSDDLLDADEIFMIDNSLGIQKVLGLESRRYYSTITEKIAAKLSLMAANI